MQNTPQIINVQPVDNQCGTNGGSSITRDTSGMQMGAYKINTCDYVYGLTAQNIIGFEWLRYTVLDNYTQTKSGERAEHCAHYTKVNNYGNATAFGNCTEITDYSGACALVGEEIDFWITTPNTLNQKDNGSRIGKDFMVAADNSVNHEDREVGATTAIRTSGAGVNSYWSFGAMLRAIRESGVQVTSWARGGIRGFEVLGKWALGLDLSQADLSTAIRLKAGQTIALEQTDTITLAYRPNGRVTLATQGRPVFEIDVWNGDIYKNGKKVL